MKAGGKLSEPRGRTICSLFYLGKTVESSLTPINITSEVAGGELREPRRRTTVLYLGKTVESSITPINVTGENMF